MTCPLVQRLMRLIQPGQKAVAIQFAIYRSSGGSLLCECNRMPMEEDSQHGSGRGQDCICDALKDLEASMRILPPPVCGGCGD